MNIHNLLDLYSIDQQVLDRINHNRSLLKKSISIPFTFNSSIELGEHTNRITNLILEKVQFFRGNVDEVWSIYPCSLVTNNSKPFVILSFDDSSYIKLKSNNGEEVRTEINFADYVPNRFIRAAVDKKIWELLKKQKESIFYNGELEISINSNASDLSFSDISEESVRKLILLSMGFMNNTLIKTDTIKLISSLEKHLRSANNQQGLDLLIKFKTTKNISFLHELVSLQQKMSR